MNTKKQSGHGRILPLFAAGLALQLFTTTAFADGNTPNLDEARRLLKAGQAKQSAALLEQDLLRFAGNADYDYLLGLALYQSGQSGEALFAFERVMMADPSNIDARLKAAQINAERGNAAVSRELLTPIDSKKLNADQQQELDKLNSNLATIASHAPVSLQGYVIAGIGWDDNVTGGPNRSALFIPGLSPLPPAPPLMTALGTAAQASDLVSFVEAGLTLRKAVAEDIWLIGAGNVRQSLNRTHSINQEGSANLELGAVKSAGRNLYGVSLMTQNYQVNKTPYRNALGARLSMAHAYEDNARLAGYLQFTNFSYPGTTTFNATRKLAGVSREFISDDKNWLFQLGAYAGQEDAHDLTKPQFSFRLWGTHAGLSVKSSDNLSLSAGIVYEPHTHRAIEPLYGKIRLDNQFSLGLAADYLLNDSWHFMPHYTHTRNASNLELYSYTRNTVMMQFKREFNK